MKYQEFLKSLSEELENIPNFVQEEFETLTERQLNWKPNPKSWSILQCLEHLILSDTTYVDKMKELLNSPKKTNDNKEVSFSLIGKWLIKAVIPSNRTKIPAPRKFQVHSSTLQKEKILQEYIQDVRRIQDWINSSYGLDINKIYLSSPALFLLYYNMSSLYQILVYHHLRHLNQALRVKQNTQFPQSE